MTQIEFVNTIKISVLEASISGTIKTLESPAGRKPNEQLVLLSNWYNNLSNNDKDMLKKVIEKSVRSSVFGFFCVLDGVVQIENDFDKGELKLFFEKHGKSTLLNDPEQEYLHNLL